MESKYYWPHWTKFNADRSLTIKTTGYDQHQTHWIDYVTVAPTDTEYEFWLWLSENRQELLTADAVDSLRQDFQSPFSEKQTALALKSG